VVDGNGLTMFVKVASRGNLSFPCSVSPGDSAVAFPMRLPARWLASAMARLTFLSGVGYVGAAYTVSRFLTRPRRRKLTKSPADLELSYRDVAIETEDGIRLAGWLIEAENARGTVALFHGMRHNRETMLSRAALLHAAGYRCLLIDHRGHGQSGGKRISFGWYEARDVLAAARWIEEQFPAQPRFALGMSMGGAAICFAGPQCGWNAIVLEGVYAELDAAFRRRIGSYYPGWFGQLYPAIVWITQKRMRIRMIEIRPVAAVEKLKNVPIMVISGERDILAPPSDSIQLQLAAQGQFAVIADACHNDICEKGGTAYRDLLLGFLRP
jgi:uncharacterized protein